MQTAFRIEELTAGYENNTIFENLNASIEYGKITTIIGPNGCGKSTLLKTIGRILKKSMVMFIYKTRICKSFRQKTSQNV